MRVFLDTNVLTSAFLTRGLCADLLRAVLQKHELITSEVVIDELRRVLREKFEMPAEVAAGYETFVRRYAEGSEPEQVAGLALDANDLRVIGSALAAGAETLVTGDKGILGGAGKLPRLRVMSPREFWASVVLRERA